ncbi:hypothetical protein K438DRAFT_1854163 [Mycena galopus ATCC 62051]|nr:hypothetical protein K438DRAFT_1854163 [Mycena galopus ATCC 62051]
MIVLLRIVSIKSALTSVAAQLLVSPIAKAAASTSSTPTQSPSRFWPIARSMPCRSVPNRRPTSEGVGWWPISGRTKSSTSPAPAHSSPTAPSTPAQRSAVPRLFDTTWITAMPILAVNRSRLT